jgi:hypothetical protein
MYLCAVLVVMTIAAPGLAQDPWEPPLPGEDSKDWVQLTSGEWLRGSIDLLRDQSMEFDSDELDDQILDWRDIKSFRSPRQLTYVFTQKRVATGTATMADDGTIRIRTNGTVQVFRRTELLSVLAGEAKELDYWSADASIGTTIRTGNTDQEDLNTLLKIRREATRSRLSLTFSSNYGRVSRVETIDNRRATGDISVFVSRRFFVTLLAGEYYSDRFQNISYRSSIGAGGGFYFFRESDLEWWVSLGGSYRKTSYNSVEAGEAGTDETGSINGATSFEMDVTDDIEVSFEYNAQVGVPDPKDTTHHAEFLTSLDLIGDVFEITLSTIYDRVETPRANADGVVPKRDDVRVIFGLGIDL